ncbi:hypothetical protein FJY63_10720, partial [Candidatus Sumerlaeota bacterium]|nr:hypothetical protein [Candidatus Sumerlaeota bacterium]
MPERYHIRTSPATPRFRPVGRLGIVDWREDCAGCHNCVKRACVYDLWRDEQDYVRSGPPDLDYIYQCKGCMNCVQDCTKGLLTRIVNPDYSHLGDEYYTPDVIQTTWWQAETGKIPVSGAGYRGPFAGSGFDAMWTDMSEIVRPTRDGIHGREYISTTVDIGRKLPYLRFDDGRLLSEAPPLIESPLPIVFDRLPAPWASERLYVAAANAAAKLGIRIVVAEEFLSEKFRNESTNILPAIVPLLTESKVQSASGGPESKVELIASAEMIEIHDRGGDTLAAVAKIKSLKPDLIVAIRVEASPLCAQRVAELAKGGAEVVHVAFDAHGRERIAPD